MIKAILHTLKSLHHFVWVHKGLVGITEIRGSLMISLGDTMFEAFVDTFFADVIFFLHEAIIAIGLGFFVADD